VSRGKSAGGWEERGQLNARATADSAARYPSRNALERHSRTSELFKNSEIEDYDKWKAVFDEQGATRQAAGSKGGFVLRNADDPNQITVLLEWDNLENARAFAGSDDLREAMQRAGVTGQPNVYFLDEADRPSV
jgi:heme-degrading monooxygenase HmoA